MKSDKLTDNKQYHLWLQDIKQRVRQAQLKAATSVNTTLLEFYWSLGGDIVEKQKQTTCGSGFLKRLSQDLMLEFPDMKGFSLNNLQYIKRWYSFYCEALSNCGTGCSTIAPQPVVQSGTAEPPAVVTKQPAMFLFQIPWGHNLVIVSKCKNIEEAL